MSAITQDTAPTVEPRFCKDCRHIVAAQKGTAETCSAQEALQIHLVRGYLRPDCWSTRQKGHPCGPAGLLFAPPLTQQDIVDAMAVWTTRKLPIVPAPSSSGSVSPASAPPPPSQEA